MAVAAYAAVVSLMHVLDQIQQYPLSLRLLLFRNQIKKLRKKVRFLQYRLEVNSQRFYEDLEGLARQIAAVAVEAEDIINSYVVDQLISPTSADERDIDLAFFWKLAVADEGEDAINSHVVDQLHEGNADKSNMDLSFSYEGIDKVIDKIDLIKEELMAWIKEEINIQEHGPLVSSPAHSLSPPLSGNNSMVGFDEHFDRVMEQLTGNKLDLQVLSILGMGGIGKTTLARNAFKILNAMRCFDKQIWLMVSRQCSKKELLQGLLREFLGEENNDSGASLPELGAQLYKHLQCRKYLIVLDDVWDPDIWDYIKFSFPNNRNRSRIMVTTRLAKVAVSFNSSETYLVDFLDKNKSWNLFCKEAFLENGCCPVDLEEVGKAIAQSCNGLPLAIVAIGRMLSVSNMTREYWECVAKDVKSFLTLRNNEDCLEILSWSYIDLPIHLKPCFLYMREFPDEIEVSELIRLWVAEGFLKPKKDKTLEEVAEEYLEDLIDRSLILRCQMRDNGKIKTCRIHDLLRSFCIRESKKEDFYGVPKVHKIIDCGTTCFLCSSKEAHKRMDLPRLILPLQQISLAKCLVCDICEIKYPQHNRLRLVKVLDRAEDILHPIKLRYLYISRDFKFVVNLIYPLWSLQTLVIQSLNLVLPSEIWELPQLRHLKFRNAILLDPPRTTKVFREASPIILENLQSLSRIENFRCSEDAIKRAPNLKALEIKYSRSSGIGWSYYSLHDLKHLHKLESLLFATEAPLTLMKDIAFPPSLKKLTLLSCNIPWEQMTIIGSLPNLEVLKLCRSAFKGPSWNPVKGECRRLRKLTMRESDLVHWGAQKVHFPSLECLELDNMKCLEKIPSEIGEIETLRLIQLFHCGASVVKSAEEILEELHDFGVEDFHLFIDYKLVLPITD